jgi:hypothetical protein
MNTWYSYTVPYSIFYLGNRDCFSTLGDSSYLQHWPGEEEISHRFLNGDFQKAEEACLNLGDQRTFLLLSLLVGEHFLTIYS